MSIVPTSSLLETSPVNLLAKRLEAEKEKNQQLKAECIFELGRRFESLSIKKTTLETDLLLRQKQYKEQRTLHDEQWTAHLSLSRQSLNAINDLMNDLGDTLKGYRDNKVFENINYQVWIGHPIPQHPPFPPSLEGYPFYPDKVIKLPCETSPDYTNLRAIQQFIENFHHSMQEESICIHVAQSSSPTDYQIESIMTQINSLSLQIENIESALIRIANLTKSLQQKHRQLQNKWNKSLQLLINHFLDQFKPITIHTTSLMEYHENLRDGYQFWTEGHRYYDDREVMSLIISGQKTIQSSFEAPIKMTSQMKSSCDRIANLSQKLLFEQETEETL